MYILLATILNLIRTLLFHGIDYLFQVQNCIFTLLLTILQVVDLVL